MATKAPAKDLAERRTEWADERTRMAEERTFAAWMRTGLALLGAGLAVTRLLASAEPQWLIRTTGVILISLGGIIFYLGFSTYRDVARNLKEEEIQTTSVWYIGILTLSLVVVAILALVLVFW